MDKPLFNFVKILVLIFVLLLGGDDVLAQVPQAVPGQMRLDAAAPKQASTPTQEKGFADKFVDWAAPEGSILATIFPTTKNCDYVNKKLYQPFSGIDKTFPGAVSLGVVEVPNRDTKEGGKITCIKVASGTEGLLKMLFTLLISIIIILSVINISVSGIQYMTEEATGQIKGGAKKRLQNSLIALALGLLSYTILYTVNKQLVAFNFNPGQLDTENSIDGGIAKAAQGLKEGTYSTSFANVEGLQQSVNVPGLYGPSVPNSPYLGGAGGGSIVDAYGNYGLPMSSMQSGIAYAKINSIENPTLMQARASGGVLNISGEVFPFRSGGGGEGYLPFGTYTITNCRIRTDIASKPTMFVSGFGYSCDLNDIQLDPRTNTQRTELRIHPDGGGPGTIGCIGIVGDLATQQRFWRAIQTYTALGKGSIIVGK